MFTVPKDFVACLHVHSPEITPKWVYVEIWGTLPCQTASMQTAFSERNLQLGRKTLFLPSVCKSSRRLFPKGSDTATDDTDDLCREICRVSGMQAGPAGTRVHRLWCQFGRFLKEQLETKSRLRWIDGITPYLNLSFYLEFKRLVQFIHALAEFLWSVEWATAYHLYRCEAPNSCRHFFP